MPKYETREDVRREAKVAGWAGRFLGAVPVKTGEFSSHDFLMQKDGVVSHVLEIKCRPGVLRYENYKLSVTKWHNLIARGVELKVPSMLVVYDDDARRMMLIRASLDAGNCVEMFQRNNRPEQPPELAVVLNWEKFVSVAVIQKGRKVG